MTMSRIRSQVAVTTAAVLLGAALGQVASAAPARLAPTTITVDTTKPFGALPRDFVGLSYEIRELSMGSFDGTKGNLVQLFKTLGVSNVRIGGNTLDRDTLWVPAGQSPPNPLPSWVKNIVTPADITRLAEFLRATGWKTEVGINVGHWDAARASDQARVMFETLGSHLTAAACGNEPNTWPGKFRPNSYGYAEYKKDWETCAKVVGNNRIAGPDTSSAGSKLPRLADFAKDERSRLAMLAVHNYAVPVDATATTLLSPETHARMFKNAQNAAKIAKSVKLPIRFDETNSAIGGGIKGVSDAYASSLWSMDHSLLLAQAGVSGVDFHGGLGVCGAPLFNGKFQHYTPICAANDTDKQARIYTAAPEYYGMYMASRMGPGKFLPVTVSSDRNVTAYAVLGDDGKTRIAVIQKDATSAAPIQLNLKAGSAKGTAEVIRLTGKSLNSKANIAVQGASIDRSGNLPTRPADQVAVKDGVLSLDIGTGSAAIITLP
jgi:hypothetical protein